MNRPEASFFIANRPRYPCPLTFTLAVNQNLPLRLVPPSVLSSVSEQGDNSLLLDECFIKYCCVSATFGGSSHGQSPSSVHVVSFMLQVHVSDAKRTPGPEETDAWYQGRTY